MVPGTVNSLTIEKKGKVSMSLAALILAKSLAFLVFLCFS
jgi:hypothetical protein